MRKLALFSEFVLRFLSVRDILYKQRDDVNDQKKSNNFLFQVILLPEDVLKRCFKIIKNKAVAKIEMSLKN